MSDTGPGSPCISVCLLDEADICVGCYRSAQEITDWFMLDYSAKEDVLRRCIERRKAANPIQLS